MDYAYLLGNSNKMVKKENSHLDKNLGSQKMQCREIVDTRGIRPHTKKGSRPLNVWERQGVIMMITEKGVLKERVFFNIFKNEKRFCLSKVHGGLTGSYKGALESLLCKLPLF